MSSAVPSNHIRSQRAPKRIVGTISTGANSELWLALRSLVVYWLINGSAESLFFVSAALTATGCATGNLTLTINRGKVIAIGSGSNAVTLEATQVDLTYPYQWQFARVVKLIAPTATFSGPAQIPSTAIMPNIG